MKKLGHGLALAVSLFGIGAHAAIPAGYFDEGGESVAWDVDHTGNFGEGGCAANGTARAFTRLRDVPWIQQLCQTNTNPNELDIGRRVNRPGSRC